MSAEKTPTAEELARALYPTMRALFGPADAPQGFDELDADDRARITKLTREAMESEGMRFDEGGRLLSVGQHSRVRLEGE